MPHASFLRQCLPCTAKVMHLQSGSRRCGTLSIPATGHDLDRLILADPTSCRTAGGSSQATQRGPALRGCQLVMCRSLCGADAAPLSTTQKTPQRICTDAVHATDRDDAKRQCRCMRVFGRAGAVWEWVRHFSPFFLSFLAMQQNMAAWHAENGKRHGSNEHMLAGDDLCVASCTSARFPVFLIREPDWPRRLWHTIDIAHCGTNLS
jgi:hypothetical protein